MTILLTNLFSAKKDLCRANALPPESLISRPMDFLVPVPPPGLLMDFFIKDVRLALRVYYLKETLASPSKGEP